MSTTIRVTDDTKARLDRLAVALDTRLQDVVEVATSRLEEAVFFDALDRGYDRLHADPSSLAEIEAERLGEEGALRDGGTA